MSAKTYLRFYQSCDILQRRTTVNDAGQKVPTFTLKTNIPIVFQALASERRTSPYLANIDDYQMYVSHQDLENIDYGYHVKNIRDRYGNILEEGPLEITAIQKKYGFGGQLHHLLVSMRQVVESA